MLRLFTRMLPLLTFGQARSALDTLAPCVACEIVKPCHRLEGE
jgi:hypothetical protein